MLAITERGFFLQVSGYAPDIQRESFRDEEEEDSRTEIIQSVSEIGDMVDFLKSHPNITMEEYKWKLNPAMVKIMLIDNTHIHYLSEAEAEYRKSHRYNDGDALNDLGIPIFD